MPKRIIRMHNGLQTFKRTTLQPVRSATLYALVSIGKQTGRIYHAPLATVSVVALRATGPCVGGDYTL